MGYFLNPTDIGEKFKSLAKSKYYVDKTNIMDIINDEVGGHDPCICLTKPRRFGKTSIVEMLDYYYSKVYEGEDLFEELQLNIAMNDKIYKSQLHKYNVINIDFNSLFTKYNYKQGIEKLEKTLIEELTIEFNLKSKNKDLADVLRECGTKFIFLIDEWDYIFNHGGFETYQNEFLQYLVYLFKGRWYAGLVYMTGILPIKQYNKGSALNMFEEYTVLNDGVFENYFGFTENEVKQLVARQNKVTIEELSSWYNGYITSDGDRIYNPHSVVSALKRGRCRSYWTKTGSQEEIFQMLQFNIQDTKLDVIRMLSGEHLRIRVRDAIRAGEYKFETKEKIYAALITYGSLGYHNGAIYIPNRELAEEFYAAIQKPEFGDDIAKLLLNSNRLLDYTLNCQEDEVATIIEQIHDDDTVLIAYNDERSFSYVVKYAYIGANNWFYIQQEETSGKGIADFIFYPKENNYPGIILELKAEEGHLDKQVEKALKQIKDKNYKERLKKIGIQNVIAVALVYDKENKKHKCKIERICT